MFLKKSQHRQIDSHYKQIEEKCIQSTSAITQPTVFFSIIAIVRPANRDWACQTERCHTLSNKTKSTVNRV